MTRTCTCIEVSVKKVHLSAVLPNLRPATIMDSLQKTVPSSVCHCLIVYSEHVLDTRAASVLGDPVTRFVPKKWRQSMLLHGLLKRVYWGNLQFPVCLTRQILLLRDTPNALLWHQKICHRGPQATQARSTKNCVEHYASTVLELCRAQYGEGRVLRQLWSIGVRKGGCGPPSDIMNTHILFTGCSHECACATASANHHSEARVCFCKKGSIPLPP